MKLQKSIYRLAVLLLCAGLLSFLPAQNFVGALSRGPADPPLKSAQIKVNLTAYKAKSGLHLEDSEYDYEGAYTVTSEEKLPNGVYKIQALLEDEDDDGRAVFVEGKTVSYSFYGFAVASAPIYRQGDQLYADLIIKEDKPAKETYTVRYLFKGAELSSKTLTLSYPVDDAGNTLHDTAPSPGKAVGDTVKLRGKSYRIKAIDLANRTFSVLLEEVRLVDLTIRVNLPTEMRPPKVVQDSWSFAINGKIYTVSSRDAGAPIDRSFSYTFRQVPLGESQTEEEVSARALSLPSAWDRYLSIARQSYDARKKELTVELGRKLYIRVSPIIPGSNYLDFALKHNQEGFTLHLYDAQGHFLEESRTDKDNTNWGKMAMFPALMPGSYRIKVASAPSAFKDYDLRRMYRLEIAPNGLPRLEVYQRDGQFHLANPYGALDSSLPPNPLQSGTKTPMQILLPKRNSVVKQASLGGVEGQELEVGKEDVVTFTLSKTIPPDHNTVVFFESFINMGTRLDQGFIDVLDSRLRFQDGSLTVTLDGQPTNDFTASYDAQNHRVVVQDVSPVRVCEFDFDRPIQLGPEQKLEVRFKVNVTQAEEEILNTVDGSTVHLRPFSISGTKVWQDEQDRYHNRPPFIEIQLLKDGVPFKTARVTPDPNGRWAFTFNDLPKFDQGREIVYSLAEVAVPGYTSEVSGTAKTGFVLSNRVNTVEIAGQKTWEDEGDKAGKRPTSITVILLADGAEQARKTVTAADRWRWNFQDLPEFINGKKVTYTVRELPVEGYRSEIHGYDITNHKLPEPPKPTPPTPPAPPPTPPAPPTPPTPPDIPAVPRTGESCSRLFYGITLLLLALGGSAGYLVRQKAKSREEIETGAGRLLKK